MRARSKRSSSSRSALTPPPEAARPSQATFSGGSPLPPVLVVEDEPAIVDLLVMLLKPLRTTLLCAHTGEEALHHLQTRRPALVTLDLVLPDMTGLRILESIRQRRDLDDTPVVMVTAQADSASVKRAYRYGASDFVAKPFSVDMLESKLRMWLRLSRLADHAYSLRDLGHEVRNPLQAIIGAAQLLGRGDLEPELRQRMSQTLVAEAERIGRLIPQGPLAGEPPPAEAITREPHRLLRDVVDVNLPDTQARARVRLRVQGKLPALRVDPDRLRQMVVNLLDNAIAATAQRGEVTIDAIPDEGRPGQGLDDLRDPLEGLGEPAGLTLVIHDSGEGIPTTLLPRIFEDGYTTRTGTARGLGLGITQRLCRATGGDLRVTSVPGQGTTFSLWLPCEPAG